MKVNSSIVASFVVGVLLASLPYTLSSGKTVAQGAGPAQTGGFGGAQGGGQSFPGQGAGAGPGFAGQGQGQFRPGGQMVNTMTTSGEFLFASAGDVIYKIRISNMSIEGQTRLPAPRGQQQGGGQGQARAGGRPPQGGGGLGGGGSIPPTK